ncbi:MAG: helix-turn-helix transcriptional regulator [Alistipes sp.]|nr:helix-turn-helix transcriptional regulator [Alistipes sp.]
MNFIKPDDQATIVKYVETSYVGIQSLNLSRCAIGYVVRGTKHVYYGDTRHTISHGEVFYLGLGNHYVEDLLDDGRPYEQIVLYYSPEQLQQILLNLNMVYSIDISSSHSCDRCRRHNHVSMVASPTLKNLFTHVMNYLHEDHQVHDVAADNLKMTELIYTIVSMEDCCFRSKVLSNVDAAHGSFEQVVYKHIFQDISIEQLASLSHRSLTSFKKEFKRHFAMSPHRWFIRQRLMRSRLLLISTSKSISEIGIECTFPNTSHFIKLFKKQYGLTPAIYRNQHANFMVTNEEVDNVEACGA